MATFYSGKKPNGDDVTLILHTNPCRIAIYDGSWNEATEQICEFEPSGAYDASGFSAFAEHLRAEERGDIR